MLYLKLMAKRKMMNDTLRCFFVSVLPFITLVLLVITNYYLPFFLKKTILSADNFILMFFVVLNLVISFCFWKNICLVKEKFFYMKTNHRSVSFFKTVRSICRKQYVTFWKVSVLRVLLSVSWATVYFLPCLILSLLLIYSYRYENYGAYIHITLFVSSVVLFAIGLLHFYVTIKRYSLCEAIILKDKHKNALNVITESISLMENHSVEYSLYCSSFIGWIFSCIFVIPIFYVLPFVNMSKWCYVNNLNKPKEKEPEKPIIFYIQKRKEV